MRYSENLFGTCLNNMNYGCFHCLGAYALHMLGGKIYTLWYFYLYV